MGGPGIQVAVREVLPTTSFRKDFKRLSASGRHDIEMLKSVVKMLATDKPLGSQLRDHSLTGNWKDHRECQPGLVSYLPPGARQVDPGQNRDAQRPIQEVTAISPPPTLKFPAPAHKTGAEAPCESRRPKRKRLPPLPFQLSPQELDVVALTKPREVHIILRQ